MKTKLSKASVLFAAACILSALAAGCGSDSEAASNTEATSTMEGLPEESNGTSSQTDGGIEEPQENAAGKWQVLDAETAAAFDADFIGKVWKIEEDSFFVAETKVKILDDGSLTSSSPSSNADVPDSQLIHVVFDDNTYFYMRTIHGNGESYEDAEAGFQDLEKFAKVEMKGKFENDIFYASEIRIIR